MKPFIALLILILPLTGAVADAAAGDLDSATRLDLNGREEQIEFAISTKRKKIRSAVIDWIARRNSAVARVSDFVMPGSRLPVHLDIDPRDDQVILEWDIRFR